MEEKKLSEETYFTFKLGDGMFAIPVSFVKEVLKFSSLTQVPKAFPYLKGVMNIRGSVVTVVDFRILFGFEIKKTIEESSIIVTEIPQENETSPMTVALVADDVDIVSRLELTKSENISFGALENRKNFIKTVAKKDNNFVLILDLHKIFEAIEAEVEWENKNFDKKNPSQSSFRF